MQIACALLLLISIIMAPAIPAGAFFPSFDTLEAQTQAQSQRLHSYQAIWLPQLSEGASNATLETGRIRVTTVQSGLIWYQEWASKEDQAAKVISAALGRETDLMASYPSVSSFPMPVLYYWHLAPLSDLAEQLGTDTSKMRFAFFANRPCLVLGDKNSGQIWLDNERNVPVRLVSEPQGWTLEFSRYNLLEGIWVPRELSVHFSNGQKMSGEIKWGAPNSAQARSILSTNMFQQRFGGFAPPQETSRPLDLFRDDFSKAVKP